VLRFKSLGSGSTGNATVVQARGGTTLTHLLVDCGLGIRNMHKRMGEAGLAPDQLDAIFVTHEHGDHIGCARRLALSERIPVYMSAGTWAGCGEPDFDGLLRIVRDGQSFEVRDLRITPFAVPHDCREPLQLHCSDGDARLGIATDLGHVNDHVLGHLAGCRTVVLECNHDEQMLDSGPYPAFLKRRVGGGLGHLANGAAADAARALRALGLAQVMAAHLSEQNNTPALARAAIARGLDCSPHDVHVADARSGCGWLTA
jgi:phosphoribosyl 1,2-cyclic phosphodiesterase